MLKWLTSVLVVLIGFAVILLALGYLLKENEAQTTALKQELDREKARQATTLAQKAQQEKAIKAATQRETFLLEPYNRDADQQGIGRYHATEDKADNNSQVLASLVRVAREHANCQSDQQCLLFNVDKNGPGCWLAVNSQGAAILAKISALHPGEPAINTRQNCSRAEEVKAVCRDHLCREQAVNPAL